MLRTASWQAQVAGGKKWHICAPDQSPYLYQAGEVDCFYPNYEKYPLFEYARCVQSEVHAGEMIFYPMDYWHQTENLATPSVGDIDLIALQLTRACSCDGDWAG